MNSIRFLEIEDCKQIAEIYNYYIKNTTITFEETPVSESEMRERIKEVIKDGMNGFLVEPGSTQGYIDRIGTLLGDDEARQAFSTRARQYTLENYGWDRMAQRYAEIFKEE